jgi:hypothetical protein
LGGQSQAGAPDLETRRAQGARETGKKRGRGDSGGSSQNNRSQAVNQAWSYDFVHNQTIDGRRLK